MLGAQGKTDFELEHDTLTSSLGKLSDLLPFSCMQNGLINLNKCTLLSNEIATVTEKNVSCY